MRILLLAFLWTVFGHAMNGERVVGHELSEFDKENCKKIELDITVQQDEMVACNYKGSWFYARVQTLPVHRALGYGTVNFRPLNHEYDPTDERNTYGGRAVHFKHVRKLAQI